MDRRVAIVTPVYRREISPEEELSLRQLRAHLGAYDRFVIAPEGLSLTGVDDLQVIRFPKRFFQGIPGYNRLMLTRRFYRKFRAYDFILIYQLDALVFSDALPQWCDAPWDYLGAPVFADWSPVAGAPMCLNGGLSLRRVAAFRRVLGGGRPGQIAAICRDTPFMEKNVFTRALKFALVTLHQFGLLNAFPWLIRRNNCHEDIVWTHYATLFDPQYRVPSAETARKFAFEQEPALMFEQNGRNLPFGCHAWMRWDADFWRRFLPSDETTSAP